jgi:hypothetical protein
LLRSEADFRLATTSREVVRLTRACTVRRGAPSNGMFLGLDNRHPLPPFFPVCRNEDGLFGRMLDQCFGDACFGQLPVAALHASAQGRAYHVGGSGQLRLSEIVWTTMQACLPTELLPGRGSWKATLEATGRRILEVAMSSHDDFAGFVRDRICAYASTRVAHYERLIQRHGGLPSFWATEVLRRIESIRAAVTRDEYYVPVDVAEDVASQTLERTQTLVRAWGGLLSSWSAVLDAGALLKSREQRLTTVL